VICLVVMIYVRYRLSRRNVEDLLVERCIDICRGCCQGKREYCLILGLLNLTDPDFAGFFGADQWQIPPQKQLYSFTLAVPVGPPLPRQPQFFAAAVCFSRRADYPFFVC
jgi:hypothetical protein